MNYKEAIIELLKGNKVRNNEWPINDYICIDECGNLMNNRGSHFYDWAIYGDEKPEVKQSDVPNNMLLFEERIRNAERSILSFFNVLNEIIDKLKGENTDLALRVSELEKWQKFSTNSLV